MMNCKELYKGKWVSNHFQDSKKAKKLMMKIIKAGGVAICVKSH